ncbi:Tat proofreading chaperone DmsD [Mannheimia sp. AT1]|uniref:Probable Tat proofreading chaperone DmsD n=1 Tax=Mannheimia cairinae TaxID=3025936 RepID=A0ABT5MNC9_9PAST|nr:Tat proofreading chaperone DmsD [Mannheimia cairinae]MDD0823517.1 Tat proofreading chaperone DmsD [Mannheimia cairinae]MDD0826730.1 Tat proofreading chaperone DmsD [Mannheimia cairinae]
MNKALLEWISVSGRLLGSLFYYAPNDERVKAVFSIFSEPNWEQQWPIQHSEIKSLIEQGQTQNLSQDYQYLFIGPNDLPTPPWSSVYLDKESVIFGESLLNLRTFLQKYQIEFSQNTNEPEDHFGLMLMLAAYLAEQKPDVLAEYLTEHLFTWAYRYLALLSEQTDYPFYQGIALLAQDTLQYWQEQANLPVKTPQLYR